MPRLTRWYLRTALIYLLVALVLGLALALKAPLPSLPTAGLAPVYFHLLMVGWVTQLIIGVVYWMFPRLSRVESRRDQALMWAVYLLLNLGLLLRLVGEPLFSREPVPAWGWLLAVSAVLQWLAGLGFVVHAWPRVRGR